MTSRSTKLLPGPALTAVGVALIRARETARMDRLYADPWAQAFVDSAASAYLSASAPDGAAEIWDRVASSPTQCTTAAPSGSGSLMTRFWTP